MIEIDDIKDRDSLKQWLEEWPTEAGLDDDQARAIAVSIAHRAAMRVLPLWWQWALGDAAGKLDVTLLPVLRCSLISGVASVAPPREIKKAAEYAEGAYEIPIADATVINAADAAAYANEAACDLEPATYASVAVVEADAAYAAWDEIQYDCKVLMDGVSLMTLPLWVGGNKPMWSDDDKQPMWSEDSRRPMWNEDNAVVELWQKAKPGATAPEWSFWVKWYDDALAGNPQNWKMLEQIALIKSEVWEDGAEAVADEIAAIQFGFAVQVSPNAEGIRINESGKFQAYPRSSLPSQTLRDVRDRIAGVVRQIQAAQARSNQYSALIPEANLLEDTLERYGENALRLHETCYKVVRHINVYMSDGDLPENDNLVGDVSGDLQSNADDIYNLDEEARTTIDARAKLRFGRLSDEDKAQIKAVTLAFADTSETQLASELIEDEQAVENEEEPSEETSANRFRLGSRLARFVAWGGKLLNDVKDGIIFLGAAGAGLTMFWKIIQALLGL